VSVFKKDKLACVNSAGGIYLWQNNTWVQAPGTAHWIHLVHGYKHVWCVNKQSQGVFRHLGDSKPAHDYSGYHWHQIPGGLVQVSAAGKHVWGVNAGDQIWRFNGNGGWDQIPGSATQVSVGWDGSVWVCNRGGQVYRFHGNMALDSGWQLMEGNVNSLAVRSYNDVYATNSAQQIFHWDGHKWHPMDGGGCQIAVGKDGHLAIVNAGGQIWEREGLHGAWHQLPGAGTQVSVHKKGTMSVVNAAGGIYTWHHGNWHQVEGTGHWISMARGHKEVWTVNKQSQGVFRHKA
jgi:hypothetical protein